MANHTKIFRTPNICGPLVGSQHWLVGRGCANLPTDALTVLSLPVGATFSMLVDFDKYFAAASTEYDYKPTPGTYSLEAQFTGKGVPRDIDLLLGHYWEGTVKSNQLRFEVPNQ